MTRVDSVYLYISFFFANLILSKPQIYKTIKQNFMIHVTDSTDSMNQVTTDGKWFAVLLSVMVLFCVMNTPFFGLSMGGRLAEVAEPMDNLGNDRQQCDANK